MPDSYEVDENGYAVAAVTFQNIPLGQYTVWEKPVLRYYLKEVLANTENVRIVKEAEAAYGKDPKEIATGVAALTMENREASLTFVNEKARYDRYSHNDCIKNTIPLLFSSERDRENRSKELLFSSVCFGISGIFQDRSL